MGLREKIAKLEKKVFGESDKEFKTTLAYSLFLQGVVDSLEDLHAPLLTLREIEILIDGATFPVDLLNHARKEFHNTNFLSDETLSMCNKYLKK
ncbi:hypothetical protein [Enterococcus alishanensis]